MARRAALETEIGMRVIQAGLGSFGKSWAELVQRGDGTILTGVVEPEQAGREWAIASLGLAPDQVFTTLDAALVAVEADAVLVITPPDTHLPVARVAFAAGKHVLTEKPLAPSLADARELVSLAAAANRTLMVSQNYRFRAPVRAIQTAIREGAIGELVAVRIEFRRGIQNLIDHDNFRFTMKHPHLIDMSIHHWDLLRAITGKNVTAIDAKSWRAPGTPFIHDPVVAALAVLEGGIPVSYHGNFADEGAPTSWNGEWEITGETGRIRWTGGIEDSIHGDVTLQCYGEAPAPLPQPVLEIVDRPASLQAFRQAVETGTQPETSGADNLFSLSCVLAAVASVEQGRPVELAEV
jgi:predicted dehydrogenase